MITRTLISSGFNRAEPQTAVAVPYHPPHVQLGFVKNGTAGVSRSPIHNQLGGQFTPTSGTHGQNSAGVIAAERVATFPVGESFRLPAAAPGSNSIKLHFRNDRIRKDCGQ